MNEKIDLIRQRKRAFHKRIEKDKESSLKYVIYLPEEKNLMDSNDRRLYGILSGVI